MSELEKDLEGKVAEFEVKREEAIQIGVAQASSEVTALRASINDLNDTISDRNKVSLLKLRVQSESHRQYKLVGRCRGLEVSKPMVEVLSF